MFTDFPWDINRMQGIVDKPGNLLAAAAGVCGVFAGVGEDENDNANGQQKQKNLKEFLMFCLSQEKYLFSRCFEIWMETVHKILLCIISNFRGENHKHFMNALNKFYSGGKTDLGICCLYSESISLKTY